jgi:PAS domain S-box-containing protein
MNMVYSILLITNDLSREYKLKKELKINHNQLKKREEDLRLALDIGLMGSYEYNFETKEVKWSDETYYLYGMDPSENITFDHAVSHIHPDDKQRILPELSGSVSRKDIITGEFRIKKDDGEIRHLTYRSVVERNDDGIPLKLHGIIRDITEWKKIENELNASKEFIEQMTTTNIN